MTIIVSYSCQVNLMIMVMSLRGNVRIVVRTGEYYVCTRGWISLVHTGKQSLGIRKTELALDPRMVARVEEITCSEWITRTVVLCV